LAWSKPQLVSASFWAVTAVVAIAVGAGGFWLGSGALSSGMATPTPTVTATPSPSPASTLTPGTYDYDALITGSCLATFPSAWEETYEVVSCTSPHVAQVIRVGQVPGYAPATFAGEAQVQATVLPLCTEPGVLDPGVAQANPNTVITFSFPVTATQWRESKGAFVCFASSADGSVLAG
jgi:hypothetical protein